MPHRTWILRHQSIRGQQDDTLNGRLQLKEYPKAILEFNEAIRLDPRKKSIYLYNLGRVDAAITAFEEAIAADNTFAQPHAELAMIYSSSMLDHARAGYHGRIFQKLSQTSSDSGQ